ncbi:MAG: hypothetical protein GVY14_14005 [Spirochaetes bacterium]|nr:hypothetical protein [Spirochaetota bacterium]
MPVTIVTGGRDAGKTQWVRELSDRRPAWGFISPKVFTGGAFVGYDLLFLPDGDRMPLARLAAGPGAESSVPDDESFRFRRFRFNGAAFDRARNEARRALAGGGPRPEAAILLDEVGPLEVDGGGFREVLDGILAAARTAVLTTRPGLVGWLTEWAGADRVEVIDLGP